VLWSRDDLRYNDFVKRVLLLILSIAAFSGGLVYWQKKVAYQPPVSQVKPEDIYQGVSYEAIDPAQYAVSILSDKLVAPTRVRATPDGNHLLVTQITGELLAFDREGDGWSNSPYLVTRVDTKFPGFPPDEAGLTSVVFSSEFAQNNKIFLLYTYQDKDGVTQNRISVATVADQKGRLQGSRPQLIYQANVAGSGSHQITDGFGISVQGEPHLLFLIGEGFKGERAQDPLLEAGKVILIQEDGSDPLGARPFPQNPKVEALGIRNAFVITPVPSVPDRFLIADTGPDKYDRLIYASLASDQEPVKPLNFGWSGKEEELLKPIPDPNDSKINDMVMYRFPETRTVTGMQFMPGADTLLLTLFGKTGSSQNSPGKEIWSGKLSNLSGQPQLSLSPIVRRAKTADGKLGNPLGLEIDAKTGDFFFADVLEGRIYKITQMKEGEQDE
jgi:hypothetical protein